MTLGDEITQIEAHAALLIATDQADEVLGDAAREYVTEVATGIVTDLVPGSATAVALGRSLFRVLRARGRVRTLNEQLLEGEPIDATNVDRDDLVVRSLDALAVLAERIPVVLAVDTRIALGDACEIVLMDRAWFASTASNGANRSQREPLCAVSWWSSGARR